MLTAGHWFWLLLIWSPTGDPDPYVLHMRYPTEEMCNSDGLESRTSRRQAFKCEPFWQEGLAQP